MAELKTKATKQSVDKFLSGIKNEQQRLEAFKILELMQDIIKEPAKMWGDSIVGFGTYHYKYKSGREGEWFLTGFSPRKQDLTLYINGGFENYDDLMQQLGKYKASKGACLYVRKLEDIKLPVLKKLVKASVTQVKKANS
jgi:nucleoid DNA-binding protein